MQSLRRSLNEKRFREWGWQTTADQKNRSDRKRRDLLPRLKPWASGFRPLSPRSSPRRCFAGSLRGSWLSGPSPSSTALGRTSFIPRSGWVNLMARLSESSPVDRGAARSPPPGLPGTAALFGALPGACTPTPCGPREFMARLSHFVLGEGGRRK